MIGTTSIISCCRLFSLWDTVYWIWLASQYLTEIHYGTVIEFVTLKNVEPRQLNDCCMQWTCAIIWHGQAVAGEFRLMHTIAAIYVGYCSTGDDNCSLWVGAHSRRLQMTSEHWLFPEHTTHSVVEAFLQLAPDSGIITIIIIIIFV